MAEPRKEVCPWLPDTSIIPQDASEAEVVDTLYEQFTTAYKEGHVPDVIAFAKAAGDLGQVLLEVTGMYVENAEPVWPNQEAITRLSKELKLK